MVMKSVSRKCSVSKDAYTRKAIELATTKEQLETVKFWADPEVDFDLFTSYSDKINELKK